MESTTGPDLSPGEPHRRNFLGMLAALGCGALAEKTIFGLDAHAQTVNSAATPGGAVPALESWLPNWPDMVEIWRNLSSEWAKLGLTLDLRQGTSATWQAQIVGEHRMPHFATMSWGGSPDRLDPDYFLYDLAHSDNLKPGGRNYGNYKNTAYDKLVEQQRLESNPAKRQQFVREAQALFAKDNPSLVLFHRDIIQAYNKEKWEGVVSSYGAGIGTPYAPWSFVNMKSKSRRNALRVTTIYDIDLLNPFANSRVHTQNMLRYIYPTLATRSPDAKIVPWVAQSWKEVDATTYDVTLRDGMTWHDGQPVTIQDFKFTVDYILKWKFTPLFSVSSVVDSAEITGPRTLRFKLKRPFAPFTSNTLTTLFIAPKHIWEKVPGGTAADFANEKAIGCGPFALGEWKKDQFLMLKAHKGFFNPPKMDALYWLVVPSIETQMGMLERGEADMLGWYIDRNQGSRLAGQKHLAVVETKTHGCHEIRMNMAMAPLNDPAFRLALQHATDRKKLLTIVFGGAGTLSNNSYISPDLKEWTNTELAAKVPEPSLDKARAVLKTAGYTWGPDNKLRFPQK
jgi:ABC-type dipeptide transport system, periplasmic component